MNALRLMTWATRVLLALAALTLMGAALLWLAQRPQFEFRRLEVLGSSGERPRHVTEASIRAALKGTLKGKIGGNFFTMNLSHTQRMFETLPWVARASVRRVWPDQLVITIEEHQAIGLWSDARVLSSRGVLFVANAAEAELDGPLASFSGAPEWAPAVAQRFGQFNAALAPLSLRVVGLDVSDRASWSIVTATDKGRGPRIELGRDEPPGRLQERLQRVAAAWPKVLAQLTRAPVRIDARYPNGFAVTPSASST